MVRVLITFIYLFNILFSHYMIALNEITFAQLYSLNIFVKVVYICQGYVQGEHKAACP